MTPLGSDILDWPEAILYMFALLVIATFVLKVIDMYFDHKRCMKIFEIPKCLTIDDIPDEDKEKIIELLEGHKGEPLDFDPSTGEYYKDRRR